MGIWDPKLNSVSKLGDRPQLWPLLPLHTSWYKPSIMKALNKSLKSCKSGNLGKTFQFPEIFWSVILAKMEDSDQRSSEISQAFIMKCSALITISNSLD